MLVCTLPSPACMCSATNTRLRSTSRVDRVAAREHRRERAPGEDLFQRRLELASSTTRRRRALLQRRETSSSMRSSRSCQRARTAATSARASSTFAVELLRRRPRLARRAATACSSVGRGEERVERVAELQLVADRQLDVDALDAVGVVAQALERNDDVLVDLERVGVPRDRGGARAVEPELLARLGGDGDEAFAAARVGDADHFGGGLRDGVVDSPTMSPISTIFGRPWRFALVA